jgi:hypothetical protein
MVTKSTWRMLSRKDSKRISCNDSDCNLQAILCNTVYWETFGPAFYYWCHDHAIIHGYRPAHTCDHDGCHKRKTQPVNVRLPFGLRVGPNGMVPVYMDRVYYYCPAHMGERTS